jgi:hypothetical protein
MKERNKGERWKEEKEKEAMTIERGTDKLGNRTSPGDFPFCFLLDDDLIRLQAYDLTIVNVIVCLE